MYFGDYLNNLARPLCLSVWWFFLLLVFFYNVGLQTIWQWDITSHCIHHTKEKHLLLHGLNAWASHILNSDVLVLTLCKCVCLFGFSLRWLKMLFDWRGGLYKYEAWHQTQLRLPSSIPELAPVCHRNMRFVFRMSVMVPWTYTSEGRFYFFFHVCMRMAVLFSFSMKQEFKKKYSTADDLICMPLQVCVSVCLCFKLSLLVSHRQLLHLQDGFTRDKREYGDNWNVCSSERW